MFLQDVFETCFYHTSGVTLLFEHSPSRASEIEHFGIFTRLQENQLTRQFFVKSNLLLFFLNVGNVLCIYGGI